MKRSTALYFILLLCFILCGCGKQEPYTDYTSYLVPSGDGASGQGMQAPAMQFAGSDEEAPQQSTASDDFASVVTIVATPAPVYTLPPTPTPTPFVLQTPQPTPAPTPVPTPVPNLIRITKSPISETLYEGGSCVFTAYADNASGITWITVSPDARNSYEIGDAMRVFPGLTVSGQGTNTLSLSNVPYAMDQWRIQAYFSGNGGPQYTAGAYLTVIPRGIYTSPTPVPTVQPSDRVEAAVSELAKQAYSEVYYAASGSGFSVGSIANYYYTGGAAAFNITATNARYQITGEFTAYYVNSGNYGYGPTHVMVYDSYGNLRANENLSGQPMSAFTYLVNQYRY